MERGVKDESESHGCLDENEEAQAARPGGERRHGDEAQGGPAVEVAAAWFTLCGCGGNIAAAAVALEPSVAASLARNGPTRRQRRWRGSPGG